MESHWRSRRAVGAGTAWEPGNVDCHADYLVAPGRAPDEVFVTATLRAHRGLAAAKHQCCLHAVEVSSRVLWGWSDR